jgi:pyruvate dehydrogenase E2 component (dihydrolipoamide acetyltransferase)
MATEILMPRQGITVESCVILGWKKREGDKVKAGDTICEVETDKAAFEIESEHEGTLLKVFFEEGADVPVLTPIAVIGQPGEDISGLGPEQVAAQPVEEKPITTEVAPESSKPNRIVPPPMSVPSTSAAGFVGISPRARNLAAAKGVEVSRLTGTGPDGRIIERDVLAVLSEREPLTPAAIAALVEQGIQAPAVGTGIGGRVTTADLMKEQPSEAVAEAQIEFPGPFKEISVKGIRQIIASRMLESLQTTAQVTINASADASQLLAYRKRLKESPEELGLSGITITDLVLYAVAKTLPKFTFLNAHFLGETIKEFERVHLGVAVDTSRGLMVPPVRNADLLSLKELSREAKRLATACQEGKILPDELTGGTFTVTNLGVFGVESFTPVLNPPEVGILGVCTIQPKPIMVADEVKYIPHLGLSLTFDHRAVDGAPAARFLQELSTVLANFDLLLVG